MKDFIKSSAKVLVDYLISLLIFVVFIYVFISIAGDKHYNTYLPFYCMFIFIMAVFIVYSDMKRLAEKEKKPQYDLHPYPAKGFIYGLVGFSPIILLEIVSVILVLENSFAERIKHLLINTLMGSTYFIIRFAGEAVWGYVLASLAIPVIAFLGYLAGHYGFEIKGKKKQRIAEERATFTKSPWNPTNKANKSNNGKKKISKKTGNKPGTTAAANKTNKPAKPKEPENQKPL